MAWRASFHEVSGIVAGFAVNAEANTHATTNQFSDRRDSTGQSHVAAWTVFDPGAGVSKSHDAGGIQLHAVGVPDIVGKPA